VGGVPRVDFWGGWVRARKLVGGERRRSTYLCSGIAGVVVVRRLFRPSPEKSVVGVVVPGVVVAVAPA